MLGFNIFRAFCVRLQSLSVVIAGRGVHRNIGNGLAVDLHIDLINAVAQIFVVFRRDAVVLQQALFKLDLPCFLRTGAAGAVSTAGVVSFIVGACVVSGWVVCWVDGIVWVGVLSARPFSQPAKAKNSTATRMAAANSLQVSSKLSIVLFVSFIVNTPYCLLY